MIAFINGSEQKSIPKNLKEAESFAVFISEDEKQSFPTYNDMQQSKRFCSLNKTAHYEVHKDIDYLLLYLPEKAGRCEVFLHANTVLFVVQSTKKIEALVPDFFVRMRENGALDADVVLAEFLLALTENKIDELYRMETRIALLEDELLAKKEMDYGQSISEMRKTLLYLKQYYQSFGMLVEDMQENLNGHINQSAIKILDVVQKRTDRIYKSVLYLRECVTQVRESYQTELDLTLNEIMKLFTLVTVIFMPLGLIAGWYGMNLIMPENAWAGTYVAVFVLCILVVIGSVWYFRRKKWF